MARKESDVAINQSNKPLSLPEIGTGGANVEVVHDFDPTEIEDFEAFMNQFLVIMVYEDNSEGALRIICPAVNGSTQPIMRGAKQKVRRKYVEALARSVVTKFDQRRQDPFDPASLVMVPVTRQTYPFTIIHDPDPRGGAWLEMVMSQSMR